MPAIETLVDGLDHPEGVAYDPSTGAVWAGGEHGQLYRVDLETRTWAQVARAPGFVLGLAVDGRGRLAVCCSDDGSLCGYDGSTVRRVASDLGFPNYPAFAPDGAVYLADSGRWAENDGRVLRVSPDGDVEELTAEPAAFPNGCAVSADGRWLWLVESYVPSVSRIDLEAGTIEHVTRIDGAVPDGIAFTGDGGALVSCYRPDRIYHLDADGTLEIAAEDPQGTLLAAPTNVCFVGERLDLLVAANFGRRHLSLLDLGLRGLPLHARPLGARRR